MAHHQHTTKLSYNPLSQSLNIKLIHCNSSKNKTLEFLTANTEERKFSINHAPSINPLPNSNTYTLFLGSLMSVSLTFTTPLSKAMTVISFHLFINCKFHSCKLLFAHILLTLSCARGKAFLF